MKSYSLPFYSLLKAISSISLMLIFLLSANQNAVAQVQHPKVSEADSLALIQIYNAMGGPNWTGNENWLTGRVYLWAGVVVPDYEDRVTELQLYYKNITGEFPDIETGLEQLKIINLNTNNLTGDFPVNICNITSLEALILSDNQIEGEIPESINKLVNLKGFDLKNNNIDSINPNAFKANSFPNLQQLDLSRNSISFNDEEVSSDILKSFCSYRNLLMLDLSNNSFNCPLPKEIGQLDKLGYLHLAQCGLSGEIPDEIGNLINLMYLNLGNNKLTGAVPKSLENLNNLEGYCTLVGNFLDSLPTLSQFPKLGTMSLQFNRFTFEDIIPNLDIAGQVDYYPQRQVGTDISIICEPGDTKYFKVELAGDDNKYQWFKDGIEIGEATQNEFALEDITIEDDGKYTMQISNEKAPLLTLESYPITIAVRLVLLDGLSGSPAEWSIKVVKVDGEVELLRVNQDAVELLGGEVLLPSDRIYTGMESSVRLAFADNSTVVVQELTDVKIGSFKKLGNAVNTQLWLKAGEVDAAVVEESAVKSDFKVRTPTATCSVRGTNFSVKHDSTSSITTVMVSEGSVSVVSEFSPADSLLLEPWQMATVSESAISAAESFSLNRIEINPDTTRVPTDNVRLFFASGYDSDGNSTSIPVHWESDAGTFNDSTNFFYSGTAVGEFTVTATEPVSKLSASAVIIVKEGAAGVSPELVLPPSLNLYQNYPNPFKTFTTIDYELPQSGKVTLKIFNILGKEVAKLVNEPKEAGKHSALFNAKNLENGTYFYKLQLDEAVAVKKMFLLR